MTGTGVDGVAVDRLLDAVRQGRAGDVPGLVKALDVAARRAAVVRLKALRTEARGWSWDRWRERARVRSALRLAGAGCHTGAAAAAAWIGGRDLSDWSQDSGRAVLGVLADRDPGWLGEVAQRLAERPSVAEDEYELVHGLVLISGCATPATDAYVLGWTRAVSGRGLLDALRSDAQTPVLVARALEMTETPAPLTWTAGPDGPGHWPSALKTLADEGVLDRAGMVDAAAARLLRGGRARDLRFPLAVLQALGLTDEERRARTADWIGMAADAPSPVAAHAQEILAALATEGALSTGQLAEMSGPVLFRTEKKLVRAQLGLLARMLRRDPAGAPELLPVVADAFGHEDTGIQERALKLVARHLPAVDDRVREELAGAAALLAPVHRVRAAEVFGAALDGADDLPYEEVLPPVPGQPRTAPPPETIAELVELLVVQSHGRTEDPVEFERALDGLVRHAHRDRAALTEAVAEAFADAYWMRGTGVFAHATHGIDVVLAALLGKVTQSRIRDGRVRGHGSTSCVHHVLAGVVDARLWEAADLMGTERLPFLVATPTRRTGAIDPTVLVDRLRAYRDADLVPAPADLAQALLRVRASGPSARRAAVEAAELGTRAGERLARWLAADASVAPGDRLLTGGTARGKGAWWPADGIVAGIRERRAFRTEFPPAFRWLDGELVETGRPCHHWSGLRPMWPAVLPNDREGLAVWLLPTLTGAAQWEERGAAWALTALAEADGPVGAATHRAVAVGLGCRHAEDRLTAVDALLVLAARGDLDGSLLGGTLAELIAGGSVKPNRLADAARTAAATGAYATVWGVLAGTLPALVSAGKPVHGLGDLLTVAAECVERSRVVREVPGLEDLAARKGSSVLLVQARRLLTALRQGTDQSPTQATEIGH